MNLVNNRQKVIFLGTPDFAVPTLKELYYNDNIDLLFAITKQNKKKGRGNELLKPPIKEECDKLGIKCYQPIKLKNDIELIDLIKNVSPDFLIVVAFGEILTKEILEIPKFGSINGHASLLPKYRGSSPIQYSLINGDKITGVSTMLLDEGLDTGDILLQEKVDIKPKMTSEELFDILKNITGKLIVDTIINFNNIKRIKQDDKIATYTKLIKKEDGLILSQSENVIDVYNKIYAFNPWPSAYINNNDRIIKLIDCDYTNENIENAKYIGNNLYVKNKKIFLKCKDGLLVINKLKPESKKIMNAIDFINGLN